MHRGPVRALRGLQQHGGVIVGVALVVAAVVNTPSYPSGPYVAAGVLSVLTASAVLVRRRSAMAMVAVTVVGLGALAAIGIGETPMWAFVELLLVAFWTTADLPRRQATVAVGLLIAVGVAFDARSGENSLAGSIVSPLVIICAPAAAGLLLRRSREQAERLRELTAELAEQRDRAAAAAELAERTRIAREIHDVVAHTVSVMLVQAGAAENLLDPAHPASQPVSQIRATGKQALTELRRVVGVLRSVRPEDTHPQPTLADLRALVDTARGNGSVVHVEWPDDLDGLPPGLQLTVFRTVQEALTNVRKHAPGAAVTVRLVREAGCVRVCVDDDGAGVSSVDDPGYGLVGLRERAELYDGKLTAGPHPSGRGWRVELELPVQPQATQREAVS